MPNKTKSRTGRTRAATHEHGVKGLDNLIGCNVEGRLQCIIDSINKNEGVSALGHARDLLKFFRRGNRKRKERLYTVKWVIDRHATSPREAARQALAVQRNPGSIATVFFVRPFELRGQWQRVDLGR